jgi:hypothetical protein
MSDMNPIDVPACDRRDECEHGSLRRQCVTCELQTDLATLREAHTETADALARSVALVRDLRAENERLVRERDYNAERLNLFLHTNCGDALNAERTRAEKAEAEVERLRSLVAAYLALHNEPLHIGRSAALRDMRRKMRSALAAGERDK